MMIEEDKKTQNEAEDEENPYLFNVQALYDQIVELVEKYRISHIDAVLKLCHAHNYDIVSISKILPASLLNKIEDDAKRLKLLKKEYCNVVTFS